ncbi:MAG: alkaline phosphatase [Victivallaceae bacterium]|nr:alkaline phosphatase [Victivallaceae bacterium]
MKRLIVLAFAVLSAVVLSAADAVPKYVFLFIGDGMGKDHVALAARKLGHLNMERLPVRGSVSTVNADGRTTDSAASATAFACGVKTLNGRLGVDTQGNFVDSCAVLAKCQGRRCAILTTVGLNNATPAAFYSHVYKRGEAKTILKQYSAYPFDILVGTGIDGMKTGVKTEDFISGAAYGADGNEEKGSAETVGGKIMIVAKNDAPFFALRDLHLPVLVHSPAADDLAKYVRKSIELMEDSPKGFFMMAEGGHIDHAAHANDAGRMIEEIRKFDEAIGVALEFQAKHPNETLIIVSADHNTGGLK